MPGSVESAGPSSSPDGRKDDILCYCFGYGPADLRADLRRNGASTIPERITAELRAGNCDCERLNPSGRCCLGEVRRACKRLQDDG